MLIDSLNHRISEYFLSQYADDCRPAPASTDNILLSSSTPLGCPMGQIAMFWRGDTQISGEFS